MIKFLFALAMACTVPLFGQSTSSDEETSITIGGKLIRVEYGAPQMHGRMIFGKFVPYGKVWRAGANEPTMLYTDADLEIGRKKIKRGAYSLWIYVDDRWKLIINEQTRLQTGSRGGYNEERDVGRFAMSMSKSPVPIEQFKITLTEDGPNLLKLQMEWEKTIASVQIVVK
jgi:hypothetical protein